MSRDIFVELGAGTAAVSHRMVGAKRVTPYAGSKLKLAKQILEVIGPFTPSRFVWVDAGEWGRTLGVLNTHPRPVAEVLRGWGAKRFAAKEAGEDVRYWTDDRELFDRLRAARAPDIPASARGPQAIRCAATHIFLQARSFKGKPVYPTLTGWLTHGFDPEYRDNKTSSSSRTNNRGWANPRWSLADLIDSNAARSWPAVEAHQADIVDFVANADLDWSRTVVYFDPPYEGTMAYPFKLTRAQVLDTCFTLHDRGARVLLSESSSPAPLVERGWTSRQLGFAGEGKRAWQDSKVQEWLTCSPGGEG